MTQKISPFLEVKYGWDFGESGWNAGMDENLKKFSALITMTIDEVISTLPTTPAEGWSGYLTTDKRIYYVIDGTINSTPVPLWATLKIKSTGANYVFNGESLSPVSSQQDVDNSLVSINNTLNSLGSAAYQDSSSFASPSSLDVVAAEATAYTDQLRSELAAVNGATLVGFAGGTVADLAADDAAKGGALVAYKSPLAGAVKRSISQKLNDYLPSAFDFGAVGDGVTDDSDAIQSAIDLFGGCYLPYTPNGYAISKPLYLSSGKALVGPDGAQVKVVKTTNTLGVGSNTVEGGALTDSYDKDAVLIVKHTDLAYATYVEVQNIHFTSTVNCEYVVYAPRMYVGAFRNVLLGMTGGKYGFYTNKTFMFSMDDVQVAGNNSNVAGSVGFWWDDQNTGASGTSISFNRCWVRDGIETGYKFRGLVYSTLTACGTDRFLKNAFWAELCDITLNGYGFENRLSTTGGDALVFRYSRIVANGLVSFSVNIGAGFYVINHTGGMVHLNGLRHTATVAGGTSIRVADNATMIRSGAAFATQVTDTPFFADSTAHITTIGNGITAATATLFLGASGSQALAVSTGSFRPVTDNVMALGQPSGRFTTIYAGNGTINTSDERSKCEIQPIDAAALRAWGRVEFMQYKFRDAVEKKGDGARLHFGVIAQRVKEAFEAEGLDAFAYGLLCYDEWPEEPAVEEQRDQDGNLIAEAKPSVPAGSRYGIRYEEALALECAYLRSLVGK